MIDAICFVFSGGGVGHTLDSPDCPIASNYLLKIGIGREVTFVPV